LSRLAVSPLLCIIFGAFLIIDKLFLHLIFFDYDKIGLGWLNPYFSHLIWGLLLLMAGLFDVIRNERP